MAATGRVRNFDRRATLPGSSHRSGSSHTAARDPQGRLGAPDGSHSEHSPKRRKRLHGLCEPLLAQDVEIAIDIHRRALQLLTLALRGGDDRGLVEIEEVLGEHVGMPRLQAE